MCTGTDSKGSELRAPRQQLAPVKRGVVIGQRMEQPGRLHIERPVGIVAGGVRRRSQEYRVQAADVADRPDAKQVDEPDSVIEGQIGDLAHADPRRSSTSPHAPPCRQQGNSAIRCKESCRGTTSMARDPGRLTVDTSGRRTATHQFRRAILMTWTPRRWT
jgi:hypothetical protein